MRTIKIAPALMAAFSLTAGLEQAALSADLPPRPAYQAPAVVVPVQNWTGCYVGGNLGAGWGAGKISSTTTTGSVSGTSDAVFVGGGQIGCDYQAGAWVFGVRNMTDWADLSGTFTPTTGGTLIARNNWVDLLTGRIGFAVQPAWLVYAQGGGAWRNGTVQQFNGAGTQIGQISSGRTGWTAGVGTEYKFAQNWSAFAEWNYADFGSNGISMPSGFSGNVSTKTSLVLFGVNYRF